LTLTR